MVGDRGWGKQGSGELSAPSSQAPSCPRLEQFPCGQPEPFLSALILLLSSHAANKIKAASGQVQIQAGFIRLKSSCRAAVTRALRGRCQQGAALVWVLCEDQALCRCHLPRDDVRRAVDPRVHVVSDDEVLHPRGLHLGEEGRR